jgi:predicted dehydrogenase
MNRLVAIDNYKRTDDPSTISPMVISGTHALDICMWCLEGKTAVECYARSVDKVLGPSYKGIDGTAGMINFSDGTIYHLNMSWALPVTWPAAVYSLEVGIVGTTGVLTIDDTHRDIVLAVSKPQSEGYNPDASRLVDFMGSYPPGDMALGELRGTHGGRNRLVAQPRRTWTADGRGDRRGSTPQPDADKSARSVGETQATGAAAARGRVRRSTSGRRH